MLLDLKSYKYKDDKDLCVVAALDECVKRTQGWRAQKKKISPSFELY